MVVVGVVPLLLLTVGVALANGDTRAVSPNSRVTGVEAEVGNLSRTNHTGCVALDVKLLVRKLDGGVAGCTVADVNASAFTAKAAAADLETTL